MGREKMPSRKITVKLDQQPKKASTDFAAMAEHLIQESWHLPPEGDQSWRERDARRIFYEDGKDEINDTDAPPSAVTKAVMGDASEDVAEERLLSQPGFRASRMVGVLLPVSLATFVACFAVALSVPEILTTGFWRGAEPKARPVVQMSTADAAPLAAAGRQPETAPDKLRPSLASSGASEPMHHASMAVTPRSNYPTARVVARADIKQRPQPPRLASKPGALDRAASDTRLAKTETAPEALSHKRAATRLPPIGEAYFASHARVAAPGMDWKTEAARWDERAAEIRAKREKSGDIALAASPPQNESEFP